MNNKLLSFAAAAASLLTIAACNKDDAQAPGVITADKTVAYAKVAISMPKVNGTRATTYEQGKDEEYAIKKITLAFYNEAGFFIGEGVQLSDYVGDKIEDNIHDQDLDQLFKVSLLDSESDQPSYVVAFVNMELTDDIKSLSLDKLTTDGTPIEVKDLFNYNVVDGVNKEGTTTNFAMSNAGYYNENNDYVVAAEFKNTWYESTELAAAGAENATIYVERLAAKMNVVKAASITEAPNYVIKDVDDATVTLSFNATNWAPTGTAKSVNAVKTKFAYNKDTETWKNEVSAFRSYWAEGVNYGKEFSDYYTSATDEKPAATTGLLDYVTYGQIMVKKDGTGGISTLPAIGAAQYVPEHTSKLQQRTDEKGLPTGAENIIANTYAFVTGVYTVNTTGSYTYTKDGKIDFYLLLKGLDKDSGNKVYTIYNEIQLVEYLLGEYNKLTDVATTPNGEALEIEELATYFGIDYVNGKYALVKTSDETLYRLSKEGRALTDEDYKLTTNSRHYHYQNGAAYFNVGVETEAGVWGVVRNHSYVLTINRIENLGAPIDDNGHEGTDDDPNPDPIIPNPDDMKDHYIKAEINVLSWHQINNNVTL